MPASEAVIEAKADDAPPGKPGPFARTEPPKGGPGGDRANAAPGRKNPPGTLRQPGIPALLLWTAAGAAVVAAVYFGSAAMRELAEARRMLGETTALSERVDALEGRFSRVEGKDPLEGIADLTARIEKLEQDMSGLGNRFEEALALIGEAGPEATATDPELLARIDRMEQAIGQIRLRLGEPQSGRDQPDQGQPGGEAAADAAPDGPEESEPWWSFLGRLLKISRVEGE